MMWVLFLGYVLPEKIENTYRKTWETLLSYPAKRKVWEKCLSSWGGKIPVKVEGRIVNYKKVYYWREPLYFEVKIYPVVDESVYFVIPDFTATLWVWGSRKEIGGEKEGFFTPGCCVKAIPAVRVHDMKKVKPLLPGDTLVQYHDFSWWFRGFGRGNEYHLVYLCAYNLGILGVEDLPHEYWVKPYFWGLIIDTMDISFEIIEPPPEEMEVFKAIVRLEEKKYDESPEKLWDEAVRIIREYPNSVYLPHLFEYVLSGLISKVLKKELMKNKRKEMYEVLDWFVDCLLYTSPSPRDRG